MADIITNITNQHNALVDQFNDLSKTVKTIEKTMDFLKSKEGVIISEKQNLGIRNVDFEELEKYLKNINKNLEIFKETYVGKNGVLISNGETIETKDLLEEIKKIDELKTLYNPYILESDLNKFIERGISINTTPILKSFNNSFINALVKEKFQNFTTTKGKITFFSFVKNLLIYFTDDKILTIKNIIKNSTIYNGDLFYLIKNTFNLELEISDITLIQPHGTGIFIGTKNNGVLFYDIQKEFIVTLYPENNVKYINKRENDVIVINQTISLYNRNNLKKVENKTLLNNNLNIQNIVEINNKIFILGQSFFTNKIEQLLYCFDIKEDIIEQVNLVFVNQKPSIFYNRIEEFNNNLYVLGFDYENNEYVELEYDGINPTSTPNFNYLKGKPLLYQEGYLYEFSKDNVLTVYNKAFNKIKIDLTNLRDLENPEKLGYYIYDGKIYFITSNRIDYYDLRNVVKRNTDRETLDFNIEVNKNDVVYVFVKALREPLVKANTGNYNYKFNYKNGDASYYVYRYENVKTKGLEIEVAYSYNEPIDDVIVYVDSKKYLINKPENYE